MSCALRGGRIAPRVWASGAQTQAPTCMTYDRDMGLRDGHPDRLSETIAVGT